MAAAIASGEEESKKVGLNKDGSFQLMQSKNSGGTASWGSQAYKNSGIMTQSGGRRITSNNGQSTF